MVYFQRYQSKYSNIRREYDGITYHSGKEAAYARELDLRIKAGEIWRWERQKKISLDIGEYHICNYFIDFVVHHKDGTVEYVEVKGFETEVWRLKWKLFEALYSGKGYVLTVVK